MGRSFRLEQRRRGIKTAKRTRRGYLQLMQNKVRSEAAIMITVNHSVEAQVEGRVQAAAAVGNQAAQNRRTRKKDVMDTSKEVTILLR